MNELSPAMRLAVDFARQNGGKLIRYPGGFWCGEGGFNRCVSFGTSTVNALVSRGIAEYIEWKDGRGGRFPVVVRVIA